MILERGDRTVNILEMKYCDKPYTINAREADKMRLRKNTVIQMYKKRMAFSTILVTTDGIVQNQYASELIQRFIFLDDLFKE